MAKSDGLSQSFFYAGYDLSGDVGSIESAEAIKETTEVTGLNSASVERVPTRSSGRITYSHFFNDATGQAHDAIKDLPTTDVQVLWAIGGSIGSSGYGLNGKQSSHAQSKGSDASWVGTVTVEGQGSPGGAGSLEDVYMLTAGLRTDTSGTNGASNDFGASGSNGIVGHLHVVDITGTNVVVTVQESSDNGSGDAFTAKLAFASVTADNKFERKTATGNVERYLRAVTSGTFSSAKFACAVRFGTAQDSDPIT